MNKFFLLFIVALIIVPVAATDSDIKITASGAAGAITDHLVSTTTASSGSAGFLTGGDNWNENNAATRVVTLGYSKYSTNLKANNKIDNALESSTNLNYDGQALAESSYHMEDNKVNIPDALCSGGQSTPDIVAANGTLIPGQNPSHQQVDVSHIAIGSSTGGVYKSAGVIDDVNTSTSMRAESDTGAAYAYVDMTSEAGFNRSSNQMNFQQETSGHLKWTDMYNTTGYTGDTGYSAGLDIQYTDHSVPFQALQNSTRLQNDPTKVAAANNETTQNISVNLS